MRGKGRRAFGAFAKSGLSSPQMLSPAPLRRFLWIVLFGGLIAALYADAQHGAPVIGAIVGASIGATLFSLERFVLRRNAGALFRRLPFLPYLALRSLLYVGVLLVISAAVNWLLTPNGLIVSFNQADFLFSQTAPATRRVSSPGRNRDRRKLRRL